MLHAIRWFVIKKQKTQVLFQLFQCLCLPVSHETEAQDFPSIGQKNGLAECLKIFFLWLKILPYYSILVHFLSPLEQSHQAEVTLTRHRDAFLMWRKSTTVCF